MKLTFAKDARIFSQAVESLRNKNEEMSEENLKAEYESVEKGGTKKEAAPEQTNEVNVSASAQKLALDNNVDLATVKGTGQKGAITVNDVKAAIKEAAEAETKE